MDVPTIARLLLRLAHAIAAAAWLGGGLYYLLALRPQLRDQDTGVREFAQAVQRGFGEWASVATLVMVATGVALMFDRLSDGQGTTVYVALLALKVGAAIVAFWMTGVFARRIRGTRRVRTPALDRAWIILGLGIIAFILGVILSSVYPSGIGDS